MKMKSLLIIALLFVINTIEAKDVKITTTPSDAKIYVDGVYRADGVYTASFKKKDEFIVVKIEKQGYASFEGKIFYNDKRNAVSYTLYEDDSLIGSVVSANANQDFTVNIDSRYDAESAWKMINQVVLTYFDEIKTADKTSGYLQTAWVYQFFPTAELKVRTRITVKESASEEGLAYKIKVSSEIARINSNTEELFILWGRILKKYDGIISEFQSRLGGL
jgi:hypothetical protein